MYRILYINATSELGGTDTDLLETVRVLDKDRFVATVVLPYPGPLDEEYRRLGVVVEYVKLSVMKRFFNLRQIVSFLWNFIPCTLKLMELIRRNRIDLVYTNSLLILNGGIAAKLLRRPAIWHSGEIFTSPRPIGQLLYWVTSALADRIIVSSDAVRSMFPAAKRGKVITVRNGIDLRRFHHCRDGAGIRQQWGIPAESPVVGFIGRFIPWKGVDYFVRSCVEVSRVFPEARFLVVGSTLQGYERYVEEVRQVIRELGLVDKTVLAFNRKDIPDILAAIDVFVHASIRPEPFGIVIVEAMAAGKPVVATNDGGVPEIINSPDVGVLVPPRDVAAMAKAVIGLLRDRPTAIRMGRAVRQRVEEQFDSVTVTRRVETIYLDVLRERARRIPLRPQPGAVQRSRVLFVNGTSEISGADISLLEFIHNMDRRAFDPVVVLPFAGPLVQEFHAEKAEVLFVPMSVLKKTFNPFRLAGIVLALIPSAFRLVRIIRRYGMTLVHNNSSTVLSGGIAAWVAGVRCVWHVREIVQPRIVRFFLCSLIHALSDFIIANSEATKRSWPKRFWPKIKVVFDNVDTSIFDGRCNGIPLRRELGFGPADPVVGFMGRLVPMKGADIFLRAVAEVRHTIPEARFLIVGVPVDKYRRHLTKLLALQKELGLEESVKFVFSRRDVPQLLAAMDIVVSASLSAESFGRVIVEAMAMGKPVIATDTGAVPEIINSPEVGVLIEAGDPAAMAQAIASLIVDRPRREQIGAAGRRRVVEQFQSLEAVREIEGVYQQLVGGHAGSLRLQAR